MFELNPTPIKKLTIETKTGIPIPNEQAEDIVSGDKRFYCDKLWTKYLDACPSWKRRRPSTPLYNCAGLVFAHRRTGIYDSEWYERLLDEEGYREIPRDKSLPGDIVAYRNDKKEILHFALVYASSPGIQFGEVHQVLAISKWDSRTGEFLHKVDESPFTVKNAQEKGSPFFYTDRPNNHEIDHGPPLTAQQIKNR